MKFGQQLERHKVAGWEPFYVDYASLKRSLKRWYPEVVGGYCGSGSDGERSRNASGTETTNKRQVSEAWLEEVEASIDRVNELFNTVADEVHERLQAAALELRDSVGTSVEAQLKQHLQNLVPKLQDTVVNLGHFAAANYTALYKIFKKHDKRTGLKVLPVAMEQIDQEPFHGSGQGRLEDLRSQLTELADRLGVDRDLPLVALHNQPGSHDLWPVARLSFSLGVISMALVVLGVLSGMEPQSDTYSVEGLSSTIPVFRLVFMMNLAVWLAGGCAAVFERYKVNYLFLLDIGPKLECSAISLLNFASVQTGIWIVLFFGFLCDLKFGAVLLTHSTLVGSKVSLPHMYTIALLTSQVMVCALWVSDEHRRWLSGLASRVFWTPFLTAPVTFVENIFADFLTSASRPLKDFVYAGCYMRHWRAVQVLDIRAQCGRSASGPSLGLQLMLVTPLVIRMAQCLRRIRDTRVTMHHLLNCGKYATAIIASVLGTAQLTTWGLSQRQANGVRTGCYVAATIYAASWDLAVDFGLGDAKRRCLYPRVAYGLVGVIDVLLRATWLLTYIPDLKNFVKSSSLNSECFSFAIGALELIRRALWACVRLEHEHLTNASRYRSVCWVPPLEHKPKVCPPSHALRQLRSRMKGGEGVLQRSRSSRSATRLVSLNSFAPPAATPSDPEWGTSQVWDWGDEVGDSADCSLTKPSPQGRATSKPHPLPPQPAVVAAQGVQEQHAALRVRDMEAHDGFSLLGSAMSRSESKRSAEQPLTTPETPRLNRQRSQRCSISKAVVSSIQDDPLSTEQQELAMSRIKRQLQTYSGPFSNAVPSELAVALISAPSHAMRSLRRASSSVLVRRSSL